MGKLDGKVALISGGARGQGAAEAETFAREGAKVVFGDIRDPEGQKVEAAIRDAQGEATYVHLDVINEADWQNAVQTAIRRYGRLNILINNAAIVIPRVPIEERTAEEWDRVMAVNLRGLFLCARGRPAQQGASKQHGGEPRGADGHGHPPDPLTHERHFCFKARATHIRRTPALSARTLPQFASGELPRSAKAALPEGARPP